MDTIYAHGVIGEKHENPVHTTIHYLLNTSKYTVAVLHTTYTVPYNIQYTIHTPLYTQRSIYTMYLSEIIRKTVHKSSKSHDIVLR